MGREVTPVWIRSPRTNGFVARMNRTLLDECFRIAGPAQPLREALAVDELPSLDFYTPPTQEQEVLSDTKLTH